MTDSAHIAVLLSTYNGEKFVEEQLDSILGQDYENYSVIVRDDGSSDSTRDILARYSSAHAVIDRYHGENLGVVRSFADLMDHTPANADYVAFCDQDDVWDPNKLSRAVAALDGFESARALMYFTSVRVVDEGLDYLGRSSSINKAPGFKNALVENVATGCTVVLNRPALQLVNLPDAHWQNMICHDWWSYLVVSAFGELVYEDEPSMSYRQHGSNDTGAAKIGLTGLIERTRLATGKKRHKLSRQAEEFLRLYGDRDAQLAALCGEFLAGCRSRNPLKRVTYAFNRSLYRQKRLDELFLNFLIAMGVA